MARSKQLPEVELHGAPCAKARKDCISDLNWKETKSCENPSLPFVFTDATCLCWKGGVEAASEAAPAGLEEASR